MSPEPIANLAVGVAIAGVVLSGQRSLRQEIEQLCARIERRDWDERFPTLDDGIDSMLKAGVLSMDDAGAYCSPIPSLAHFAPTSDDPAPSGGTSGPPAAGRTHSPAPG